MTSSLGLDASRSADPVDYAFGTERPRVAVKPTTADEVAEALRAAAADGMRVVVWGAGVSLHMVDAPSRYDVALDTTAMNQILEYDANDQTITAQCGVTLDTLRATVAAKNQDFPIEGARADVATLGGALSSNTSGARRFRLGAPVDRILGGRFALGDGTIARTGGKVVKNVAGFAVHRLMCGAHGSLGVLLEASIKLIPQPDVRRVLIYPCDANDIGDAERWKTFDGLEPAAVSVVGRELARTLHIATPTPSDFVLVVGFEDVPAWIDEQVSRTKAALGDPVAQIDGDDVNEMWQALADLEEQPAPRMSFTTAQRTPVAVAAAIEAKVATGAVFHASAGRLHVHLDPRDAEQASQVLGRAGFTEVDRRGVPGEPAAPVPALHSLREVLRQQLDPGDRFATLGPWRALESGTAIAGDG